MSLVNKFMFDILEHDEQESHIWDKSIVTVDSFTPTKPMYSICLECFMNPTGLNDLIQIVISK